MNTIQSFSDFSKLLKTINSAYHLEVDQIYLHRDMIGYVYFLQNSSSRYVLKVYRSFNTDKALQSVSIIQHLKNNDYPVVTIVPDICGNFYRSINTPSGQSVAILFDYIDGTEPDFASQITNIGVQTGRLHKLMAAYPDALITRGKVFYVDRFISILHKKGYDTKKIDDLQEYGSKLWASMQRLPQGFCHGDLHSGNMLQTKSNEYVLFDFDAASNTYSVIDAATLSDGTDFNNLIESSWDRTLKIFEKFYQGYSKECVLNSVEIAALFDFIAVRHYEIIATITQCQGLQSLSNVFLDEQYEWLMKWQDICARKASRII